MAGLIKNQILKHLSKFAKNLNAESINVSTLKGEGDLKNLELNEQVLTDLLELPTWLRLTRASVNRVSVKIQWTKLKSVPIHLSLDEVVVAVETCEELRPHTTGLAPPSHTSGGHYGFSEKVVDGLTVTVNSVRVTFKSAVFSALFQLSWQSLRVEATSNEAGQGSHLAPLRLLTNACHCRLTIKKKLADFYSQQQTSSASSFSQQQQQPGRAAGPSVFHKFDVIETSYHLVCERIDLYLCDDPGSGRSSHPQLASGASLQFAINHLRVDYYPYHLAAGGRCHWVRYNDCGPQQLAAGALAHFRALLVDALSGSRGPHAPLARAPPLATPLQDPGAQAAVGAASGHVRALVATQLRKLMSSVCVVSIKDFVLYRVTTSTRRLPPKQFISSDKERLCLPTTTSCVHLEFSSYYFPGDGDFPGEFSSYYFPGDGDFPGELSSYYFPGDGDFPVPPPHKTPQQLFTPHKTPQQLFTPTVPPPHKIPHQPFTPQCHPHTRHPNNSSPHSPTPTQDTPTTLHPTQDTQQLFTPHKTPQQLFTPHKTPQQLFTPHKTHNNFLPHTRHPNNSSPHTRHPNNSSPHTRHTTTFYPTQDTPTTLHPTVVLEASTEPVTGHQKDRPRGLQVQASRVTLSNCRPPDPSAPGSLAALGATLEAAQTTGQLFFASDFPARADDFLPVACKFVRHAMGEDNIRPAPRCASDAAVYEAVSRLSRESLWTEARDLLFLHCDPLWVEFTGTPSFRQRPLPFVDAFPLSVWIHLKMPGIKDGVPIKPGVVDEYSPVNGEPRPINSGLLPATDTSVPASVRNASAQVKREKSVGRKEAACNVLVHCHSLISCQLNHFQLLFLMRQLDMLTELSAFLTSDTRVIYDGAAADRPWVREIEDSLVVSAIVPQLDLTFVIPPLHPAKDSMHDMEGFVPDSSSTVGEELDSLKEMRGSASDHSLSAKAAAALETRDGTETELPKSQSDGHLSGAKTISTTQAMVKEPVASGYSQLPQVNLISPSTPSAAPSSLNANHGAASNSIQDNLNIISFTSMKKGFSSLMTSLETTVKTSPDDISDTISIQSDISSDSENFVLLNLENNHLAGAERSDSGLGVEAAFRGLDRTSADSAPVEVATEAFEETTPSEDLSEITSTFRRKGNVALVNVQLSGLQFIQEAEGFDSVIKIEAQRLHVMDCNAVPYEEFQSKFSSRSKGWHDCFPSDQNCTFRIRLDTRAATPSQEPPDGDHHTAAPDVPPPAQCAANNSAASKALPRPSIGPFSFAHSNLKKSLDQFDETDALNLWKKCTSYSPKLAHMFPKWTRRSCDGPAAQAPQEDGLKRGPSDVHPSEPRPTSGPQVDPPPATATPDKRRCCRYSVPELPVQVVQELHAVVGDVSLDLLLSSLSGLADLLQDELPPEPLACSVEVFNTSLVVREDVTGALPGTPEGVKRLLVPALLLQRDAAGTFVVLPGRAATTAASHGISDAPAGAPSAPADARGAPAEASDAPGLAKEVTRLREALELSNAQLRATVDENLSLREALRVLRLDCDALLRQQKTPLMSACGGGRDG
ncbi:uncharacterized protein LOC108673136 [Hyalella azteca]|uniref:Uncharacterized protein LOC108673136 n=1 Tax=Hyalella azteca TaxID=294128 RepID=A0A979FJM1_HYAAZ|nr:uncharacterized protein LOC108673136 [Hyalella azteca]